MVPSQTFHHHIDGSWCSDVGRTAQAPSQGLKGLSRWCCRCCEGHTLPWRHTKWVNSADAGSIAKTCWNMNQLFTSCRVCWSINKNWSTFLTWGEEDPTKKCVVHIELLLLRWCLLSCRLSHGGIRVWDYLQWMKHAMKTAAGKACDYYLYLTEIKNICMTWISETIYSQAPSILLKTIISTIATKSS